MSTENIAPLHTEKGKILSTVNIVLFTPIYPYIYIEIFSHICIYVYVYVSIYIYIVIYTCVFDVRIQTSQTFLILPKINSDASRIDFGWILVGFWLRSAADT